MIRTTLIAAATAASLAFGAVSVSAAPLNVAAAQPAAAEASVTDVGGRHRHRHGRHRHGAGAAIAFGALTGLAVGAAIASSHRRDCWVERVEVFRPAYGGYVIEERTVCR